ncbi:MAG TPA: HAMP domain-containing sensor histidine kinase [Candidatus Binataceae bacterium]
MPDGSKVTRLGPWYAGWRYDGAFRQLSAELLANRIRLSLVIALVFTAGATLIELFLIPHLWKTFGLANLSITLGILALYGCTRWISDFNLLRVLGYFTLSWVMIWVTIGASYTHGLVSADQILIGLVMGSALLIPSGTGIQALGAITATIIYIGYMLFTPDRSTDATFALFWIAGIGALSVLAMQILEESRHRIFAYGELEREFIATLSHDVRAPAAAISMRADLLRESVEDPEVREGLAAMQASATQILNLAQNMVDGILIENGALNFRPEVFDLNQLVSETASETQGLALAKRISITARLSKDLPMVMLDPLHIKKVLINLLANALRFAPRGGKVEVATEETPQGIRLSLRDNGPGLNEAQCADLLSKEPLMAKRTTGGADLGLFIVKNIVDQCGAKVDVESTLGQGATFTVVIPRSKVMASISARKASPAMASSSPAGSRGRSASSSR